MANTKKILVVDYNRRLNSIYSGALAAKGFAVQSVFTLAEARQRLEDFLPDVILMEAYLPDGNGIDFCREIRKTISARVIFLTIASGSNVEYECIKAGADECLRKPYSAELLTLRVANSLRRYDGERINGRGENEVERKTGDDHSAYSLLLVGSRKVFHDEHERSLGEQGYKYRISTSGADAIAEITSHRFDCIAVDDLYWSGCDLYIDYRLQSPSYIELKVILKVLFMKIEKNLAGSDNNGDNYTDGPETEVKAEEKE